ncbi:MAG: lytic transglycosylase domain-containing protein [Candidatus Dadabacteria bacterium]|nr:lytic transglycosylase domain-containing protein [Candidatus Dadabacteria bacterium]NIS09763.1 lytic transglycosylase domain-containing protein [Candidatus Dadabacteria bacterium]NIY22531.1 transglycosylase SLT domain-containing protein [Candidatus Dadabacteria bacterium]
MKQEFMSNQEYQKIAKYTYRTAKFGLTVLFGILLMGFIATNSFRSLQNYKQPNNLIGSLVSNLNITGLDDSSYDVSYKVASNEILKNIRRYSSNLEPEEAHMLADLINKECKRYNLNPYLVLAIIKVESSFNPMAVSSKGAVGLMQVMPETAVYLASKKGMTIDDESLIADPLINVQLGIYYFHNLLKRYNKLESALFAYNYGPGKFETITSREDSEVKVPEYVNKVITFKKYLERKSLIAKQS